MVLPFPFTRALYIYGKPLFVPRDGDTEEWRRRLEVEMNELADDAERLINA
jgi:lysophospholipid acyltransferase (LPLAT)-like uncharacterized protein